MTKQDSDTFSLSILFTSAVKAVKEFARWYIFLANLSLREKSNTTKQRLSGKEVFTKLCRPLLQLAGFVSKPLNGNK